MPSLSGILTASTYVVYLVVIFWLRYDLARLRKVGVRTAPNLTAILTLLLSPYLGTLVSSILFEVISIDAGYYRSYYVPLGGMFLSILIAGIGYSFYRFYLSLKINPDNPPLAPLAKGGNILFWMIWSIYAFYTILSRILPNLF